MNACVTSRTCAYIYEYVFMDYYCGTITHVSFSSSSFVSCFLDREDESCRYDCYCVCGISIAYKVYILVLSLRGTGSVCVNACGYGYS